jgi:hypothetical protein
LIQKSIIEEKITFLSFSYLSSVRTDLIPSIIIIFSAVFTSIFYTLPQSFSPSDPSFSGKSFSGFRELVAPFTPQEKVLQCQSIFLSATVLTVIFAIFVFSVFMLVTSLPVHCPFLYENFIF